MDEMFAGLSQSEWGYELCEISASELCRRLSIEVDTAIQNWEVGIDWKQSCRRPEFWRGQVKIRLPPVLGDQLMNGRKGYRAQYAVSAECGQHFNNALLERVVPALVAARKLYSDLAAPEVFTRSMRGTFTKIWFSNSISDPAAHRYLMTLPEVLQPPLWKAHWRAKAPPRKGLLAPACTEILINGTFVSAAEEWDQKPSRAQELHATGWT